MGLFGKKEKAEVEFEATDVIFVGSIDYDANRKLIRVKNGFQKNIFATADVEDIIITCGQKTVSKKNLGGAIAGAALFGTAGILLAGTHDVEYISNLTITFVTKEKRIYLPLVIGKTKKGTWLETAEKIVNELNAIIDADDGPAPGGQVSAADEIMKYKALLDQGIITQEEFEAKKRQLLGL